MGNTNQSSNAKGDLGSLAVKGLPIHFHHIHSENIELLHDRRRAKRIESFCKGICFCDRPIAINERVYIKFAEVSTSWSGVVRFGFTSHDPETLNPAELPRYACPDLTNKPGYWAKALPERFAEQGNVLFFYVTRSGDVMFGVNGEEMGVFFSGVTVNVPLWALVDIYGNTTAMEFVDGRQMNNLGCPTQQPLPQPAGTPELIQARLTTDAPSPQQLPLRYHAYQSFTPLAFHSLAGRNVMLSAEKTVAVRKVDEYCNGYVFTHRPLKCGEKLVVQILAVDNTFHGGIAFGMTSCDPTCLSMQDLPDDSDMLLDRLEYWVVNKDVCVNPEVGDELSFFLTEEGEVIYGRNSHAIATLMHVDKTLPMWAFLDVYGTTQKIKCIGVMQPSRAAQPSSQASSLTVALPPPRPSSSPTSSSAVTPPPRPPPPRTSPACSSRVSPVPAARNSCPPTLPPKQHRPVPQPPAAQNPFITHGASSPALPPPLIPTPTSTPPVPAPRHHAHQSAPAVPQRPNHTEGTSSQEAQDNACNECSVCLDKPVDCVLYTCGHLCVCYSCGLDIKQSQGVCPICRQEIKDIIKIFRS